MKKILTLVTVVFAVISMVTACSIANNDTLAINKLDLSKESFKMKIQDAYMTTDQGVYYEEERDIGIVVHGNIKNGKIHEGSEIIFVDENGKALHNDKVFKIVIIEVNTGTEQKARRQSYAESGDNVALYLNGWNGYDDELYSKHEKNLELIRKSQFAIM